VLKFAKKEKKLEKIYGREIRCNSDLLYSEIRIVGNMQHSLCETQGGLYSGFYYSNPTSKTK